MKQLHTNACKEQRDRCEKTHRQRYRETERTGRQTLRGQADRETDRQTDTERQTDREDRQTNIQPHRQTTISPCQRALKKLFTSIASVIFTHKQRKKIKGHTSSDTNTHTHACLPPHV